MVNRCRFATAPLGGRRSPTVNVPHGDEEGARNAGRSHADEAEDALAVLQRLIPGFEQHLFGQKAEGGRNAGHGERGQSAATVTQGRRAPSSARLAQIACAGRVVDNAGNEKERALIEGMGQNADDRRPYRRWSC